MLHRPTETLANAADCPPAQLGRLPTLPRHALTPPWDGSHSLSVPRGFSGRSHQVQHRGPSHTSELQQWGSFHQRTVSLLSKQLLDSAHRWLTGKGLI